MPLIYKRFSLIGKIFTVNRSLAMLSLLLLHSGTSLDKQIDKTLSILAIVVRLPSLSYSPFALLQAATSSSLNAVVMFGGLPHASASDDFSW